MDVFKGLIFAVLVEIIMGVYGYIVWKLIQ